MKQNINKLPLKTSRALLKVDLSSIGVSACLSGVEKCDKGSKTFKIHIEYLVYLVRTKINLKIKIKTHLSLPFDHYL
jgi:CRISPR/Cas system type I-B associated protein Csh2 (Cas7 group RAMP superfamily)